ncbi:MAG TPA: hypothetical protein VHG91_17005, partial [Longimicrobium sp.]|nr:hypothetical protein [Longimicrobium sp.]
MRECGGARGETQERRAGAELLHAVDERLRLGVDLVHLGEERRDVGLALRLDLGERHGAGADLLEVGLQVRRLGGELVELGVVAGRAGGFDLGLQRLGAGQLRGGGRIDLRQRGGERRLEPLGLRLQRRVLERLLLERGQALLDLRHLALRGRRSGG